MSDHTIALLAMLGTWAASVAIGIAFAQIRAGKRQAETSFEDDLSREYRSIMELLPAAAFYTDGQVTLDDQARIAFYRYFDLSNEELFYARMGRVSTKTATQWREGIEGNIRKLPAFESAWNEIASRVPLDFFEDLRATVAPTPVVPSTSGEDSGRSTQ